MRMEDGEFAKLCEELAENTVNPADKKRWRRAAQKWRKLQTASEQADLKTERPRRDDCD
jgi:hypothetical protein